MKKLIFLLSIAVFIYAQEYQITTVPVFQYSIDRWTNEIYYQNYFTGDIYKTNSTGTHHTLTEFPSVPQFSNNNHTAAFMENTNLYLHNFEMDTSYFLGALPYFSYYLLFSPSDTKIVYGGDAGVPIVYFSFEDSSVHNTGITIYDDVMQWLNDTTIVYITLGGVDIRLLNINNLNENIVVQSAYLVSYRGLATNKNIGAFAYSWEYNSTENTFINLYYPQTNLDTTVYNFQEQGPFPGNILLRDLSWERNSNKLGFIGEIFSVPVSLIFVFEYNSYITSLYSDMSTNGDGNKYFLEWLNRDTVIYSDWTDARFLFGLDVTNPVSVEDKFIVLKFSLAQNYPNPFNPTTSIRYHLPERSLVTIKVYDVLGNEVVVLVNDEKVAGEYEVVFNGKDLASGIYFYQFTSRNFMQTRKMILLK
jgi:hypothetical protein